MEMNKQKIEKELDRLDWTKYDLAKAMGVKPQWIYRLMSNDYDGVTLKTVSKIATALDLDPKDLIK